MILNPQLSLIVEMQSYSWDIEIFKVFGVPDVILKVVLMLLVKLSKEHASFWRK